MRIGDFHNQAIFLLLMLHSLCLKFNINRSFFFQIDNMVLLSFEKFPTWSIKSAFSITFIVRNSQLNVKLLFIEVTQVALKLKRIYAVDTLKHQRYWLMVSLCWSHEPGFRRYTILFVSLLTFQSYIIKKESGVRTGAQKHISAFMNALSPQ